MFRYEASYMREKRITVGDAYMEVDVIPRNLEDERYRSGRSRKRKENVTAPAQSNLNNKNAQRYLVELGNGNFTENDIYLTLTFDPKEELSPKTIEDAEKNVTNYLRRLKSLRKRRKLEPLKYILVTEYHQNEEDVFTTKIHHHLVINGGIDRDTLEKMWSVKMPGTTKRRRLGYADARRLQFDEGIEGNGIERLMKYMTKDPKGKNRWSSSRNLKRPVMRKNNWKYRAATIAKAKNAPDNGMSIFSKQYPEYEIKDNINWEYNELTGWHVYLKMWKKSTERVI